jgi:signal transduction histidine kinase
MSLPRGGVLALAVAAALAVAGMAAWQADPGARLACRILPGGLVPPLASSGSGCALRPYDRVLASRVAGDPEPVPGALPRERAADAGSLELLVERRGRTRWVDVPVESTVRTHVLAGFAGASLVTVLVMTIALLVLRGSSHPAAVPFARFYACVSVVLAAAISGRDSDALVVPGALAGALVPATLVHLALTFPRARKVPGGRRRVLTAAYGCAALLALVSVASLERAPGLWSWIDRATLGLTFTGWVLLVGGCIAAALRPGSALERARARVLLAGSAALPSVSVVVGSWFGAHLPGGSQALAALTVAALPMPIGYAISRHRLFDLSLDLRRAVAHLVYVAVSATGVAAGVALAARILRAPLPLGDPLALYAAALGGFALADPLRARLRGALDRWKAPGAARMAALAESHAHQVGGLLEPDACAAVLCRMVTEGVDAVGASVFLQGDADLRLGAAIGFGAPVRAAAAALALEASRGAPLCLVDAETPPGGAAHRLRELGAEMVVPLRSAQREIGVLVVTASRRGTPYTSPQLDFVVTLGHQSAIAIHRSDLARSLIDAERQATRGRLGAELIHDLGKPLGVLETLAGRLPARLEDPDRLARDARTISELAAETRTLLRDFLDASRLEAPGGRSTGDLAALVDRAVRQVELVRGRQPVCVRLEPDLPRLGRCEAKLVRALANLIDNALLASDRDDVVEVVVTRAGDALEVVVVDRGCGMSAAELRHAFEPFYTTRPCQGSGLGLTACQDLAESLGGEVRLESTPGVGTRACLRIPLAR